MDLQRPDGLVDLRALCKGAGIPNVDETNTNTLRKMVTDLGIQPSYVSTGAQGKRQREYFEPTLAAPLGAAWARAERERLARAEEMIEAKARERAQEAGILPASDFGTNILLRLDKLERRLERIEGLLNTFIAGRSQQ